MRHDDWGHEPLVGEQPVRAHALVTLAATLAAAAPSRAQESAPLSTSVALADFGVAAATDVVRGRVSVVHSSRGPRLEVQYLTDVAAPQPAAGRAPEPGAPGAGPAAGSAAPDATGGPAARRAREPSGGSPGQPLTSLWVWGTARILADESERSDFLALVEEQGIDRIFLQLTPAAGLAPSAGFVPFDGSVLGPLVAELRARGALTYALDGDPEYARARNHEGVARTVARVVEHNRTAPPEQRFHGVRYDVEPYLLPGFQGPRRAEILSGYLRLLESSSRAARVGGLAFAVDIPFWLDGADEVSGAPFEAEVEGGRRVPVLGRVLDLVDEVAVMAYRTVAAGSDGVLSHAGGEIARAAERGVDVFVGIETTPIADEERYTLRGRGRTGLPPNESAAWIVLEALDEELTRVWLIEGAADLGALRRSVGADTGRLTYWFAGVPVPLDGARLSFHSLGLDAMRRMEEELLQGLGDAAAFRGVAYHDYAGLRTLLGR